MKNRLPSQEKFKRPVWPFFLSGNFGLVSLNFLFFLNNSFSYLKMTTIIHNLYDSSALGLPVCKMHTVNHVGLQLISNNTAYVVSDAV